MENNKVSLLNGIVIILSALLVLIGLLAMIDGTTRQNGLDSVTISVILGASLFIVGSIGLIIEVLIYNLKSFKNIEKQKKGIVS